MADYARTHGPRPPAERGLRRLGQRSAHARGRRATRWRSTPRPSWRPSPASGAGTSSTGPRRPAGPARCCRSGPAHRGGPDARHEGPADRAVRWPASPRPGWRRDGSRAGAARVGPLRLVDIDPPGPAGGRTGRWSGPGWRGSAAATWPRWTDGRRDGSSRSSASRSSPATRSSATPTTAGGWCIEPVLHCPVRGIEPPCAALRGRADQPLRAAHRRPPAARSADRLLRRYRRRLVAGPGRPRPAAAPVPDGWSATRPRSWSSRPRAPSTAPWPRPPPGPATRLRS